MLNVPKTHENLSKCKCMKCPSYTIACKMRSMPGNVILIMGDMEKIHAEAMFCAYEKSKCIDEEKRCICGECEISKEYKLDNSYFCIETGGKK